WLRFPPDMTEKQNNTQNLHQKGTGNWLLDDDRFVEWQNYAGSLWIHGPSGAGKSVLCSIIIGKLRDDQWRFKHEKRTAIAFFYFDFKEEKRQSVEIALRRIVLQLSAQSPHFYQTLNERYRASNGQFIASYDNLLQVLEELLKAFGHTYIVLDALDECRENDHQRLVNLISTLQSWSGISLHLLVISQPRSIFTEGFGDMTHIALQLDNMKKDIEVFVITQLRERPKLKHLAGYTRDIIDTVLDKSNGMFRLAACLLDEISRHPLPGKLKETLTNLPSDLHAIYDRFFQRIPTDYLAYVENALHYIIFSARPVTLCELDDALAVNISSSEQY
ncbi:hypothetical protein GGX14DRAFT_324553, partial [Mycena pura]